jgi:S1-C subfamily serine protease
MASDAADISSILMRSTFRIQDEKTLGTVFIMGEPIPDQPGKGTYVLITAAHVLDDMKSNTAILFLRKRVGNTFVKIPFPIQIRENGNPRWVRHPKVDVAAMRVALPQEIDIQIFSTELLADDKMLEELEIHPGDELLVLGFPYGAEANEAGFPILRSGRIAGFPLTPTSETLTFLLDFPVFNGNSGGPVFMHHENRSYKGGTHIGVVRLILGVVSQERGLEERVESISETLVRKHKLGLAVIVHARFVKEILTMLPPLPVPPVKAP